MRNIIIQDYLSSLKEDKELDHIFPLLLENMGFQIVSTPKNSKGQPQYGKDIVAIGCDEQGKKWKWYFELKGNAAKDINDHNFNMEDGVRESLLAAKDVDYKAYSIPGFNELPTKIVLVHNGIITENFRKQFEEFLKKNFEDKTFERWGIEKLTELFSKNLFDECLFSDEESYVLMKRTLVLLDTPSENYSSLNRLILYQFEKCNDGTLNPNSRKVTQLFSSLLLICSMIEKYSEEYDNLTPSKYCINLVLLKSWAFILKNKWHKKKTILKRYYELLNFQFEVYQKYVEKTFSIASTHKGLYAFGNSETESVCYPIRCFQYLNDILYYAYICECRCNSKVRGKLRQHQIQNIKRLVLSNSGFDMTVLDTHSITVLYLFLYILGSEHTEGDVHFLANYISRIIQNLIIRFRRNKMLPETYGNEIALARSIYKKSDDYVDESSLLILNLVEIVAYLNIDELYQLLIKLVIESGVDLQLIFPIINDELETNLFEGNISKNIGVESTIQLPNTIEEFQKEFRIKCQKIKFKADHAGFPYLKNLAHMFYKIDIFPSEADFGFIEFNKNTP